MAGLNRIGIAVRDMEASIRFYRLLGLDVPDDAGDGHVDILLPDGGRLMLDSEDVIRSFLPDWTRTDGNQVSLAFECESPANVDELYERAVDAGYEGEKPPWDADWGQRYALLGDPDGVRVNLYAPLAG